ncbi:MAG: cyclic nucleotide-binding domain-containing protein [Gammaproteobacteria bacterium]|jgi:CRP-like cAMP-binding protein
MTFNILTPGKLKQFYPLESLAYDEVNIILEKASVKNVTRGNIIFAQGDDDTDVYYLLDGRIRLESDNGAEFILDSESEQSFYPIANIKPRKFAAYAHSDTASLAVIPTKIIETFIFHLEKDELWASGSIPIKTEERIFDSDWMMALKSTPLFQKLQDEYLNQLFHVMDEKNYKSGEDVITQGEPGDYFYLIKEGICAVFRQKDGKEIELAKLRVTDSFGEDALLTDNPRNATVRMISDGTLMRISKKDFQQFMFQPIVQSVVPDQAQALLRSGAMIIDVRKNRDKTEKLENAKYIPLFMLRNQLKRLDKTKVYLILCDDSHDGAIASYLFNKFGLNGYLLHGANALKQI